MAKLTRSELDAVIAKFAPFVCFHPNERYFPCSVEWFLERAKLRRKDSKEAVAVTVATLPNTRGGEGDYWLEYPDTADAKAGKLDTARVYVHARLGDDQTFTDLQYWYFYAYNGPGTTKWGSLVADTVMKAADVNMAPLGEHYGDWEHVTVRVDNATKRLLGYYLSQHSGGEWVTGDELGHSDKIEQDGDVRRRHRAGSDQLIVYPSLNGHGFYRWRNARNYSEHRKYAAAGTGFEMRICNDTDDSGRTFDSAGKCDLIAVSPASYAQELGRTAQPRWLDYPYRWGPEGTRTVLQPSHVRQILMAALGPVGLGLSLFGMGIVAAELAHLYRTDDLNGPEGPKRKAAAWSGAEIHGQEETHSTPFVTAEHIYFRGTDDKLRRMSLDGSGTQLIGGHTCNGAPVVSGAYVYFRGLNDGLYRVRLAGAGFEQIGGHWTLNQPFVYKDWVYFQGGKNELCRVETNGRSFQHIGGHHTHAAPFVHDDDHVYFMGADQGLYRIHIGGGGFRQVGSAETIGTPCVSNGWVYFRGKDEGLYRVQTDGQGLQRIGRNYQGDGAEGYFTRSAPVVSGDWVYFRGKDNGLYRVRTDGSVFGQIGGHSTSDPPFVVGDRVYFRGMNQRLLLALTGDRT